MLIKSSLNRFESSSTIEQSFVVRFFSTGTFPKGSNSAFITLIPKVSNPLFIKDYRPISLIGIHYKIVAKILANRLSKVTESIISPEQTAFIKGRQILDGPLILSETIDWYKKRKKKMMLFKVDFEKAFDSVSWRYLDYVLDKLGFGIKWRNWIKAELASARTSILINGSPTSEFSLKRALRQGDPLSPFLFIIIMEGLHMALNDGLAANMFHGVKVGSPVRVSCNEVEIMASYTGCEAAFFPFTYLGLPNGSNMSRIANWQPLIDRFKARLSGWKASFLSIGCRLTLIKSVLGSLGNYYLSIFKVPETVVKSFESLRASFFWGSSEDFKKLAWVKWSNILASLDKGGLGVGSLKAFRFRPVNVGRTKAEFDALISDIANLKPEELVDSDTCIWSLSHDDKFSVNSVRKHIDELYLPSLSLSTGGVKLSLERFYVPFIFIMWRVGSLVSVMALLKGKEGSRLRHLCCFLLDLIAVEK
ncbi:RNA-directed DNA polymerase, eukaryota, reverse transcriptase zinc-binding domain protein [Tanacetum coccineum]